MVDFSKAFCKRLPEGNWIDQYIKWAYAHNQLTMFAIEITPLYIHL